MRARGAVPGIVGDVAEPEVAEVVDRRREAVEARGWDEEVALGEDGDFGEGGGVACVEAWEPAIGGGPAVGVGDCGEGGRGRDAAG